MSTDYEIYKNYNSSVKNITVSILVRVLWNYRVYEGIRNQQVLSCCNQHVVLKEFDSFLNNNKSSENKFYISSLCIILSSNETCTECFIFESSKLSQIREMTTIQSATNLIHAKSKALISKLSNEHVKKMTLLKLCQNYWTEIKASNSRIDELQLEIERSVS